jgi:hypothetical protein
MHSSIHLDAIIMGNSVFRRPGRSSISIEDKDPNGTMGRLRFQSLNRSERLISYRSTESCSERL